MRTKIVVSIICFTAVCGCSKHDPILPGMRTAIFEDTSVHVLNNPLPAVGDEITRNNTDCPYTIDDKNSVWMGDKRVFMGLPMGNSVKSDNRPVCDGKYVYVGLGTGELAKINPATHTAVWQTDVYRANNMTGGASLVDIVVPPFVDGKYVMVGGLGDAFCRINAANGAKKWCVNVGIAHDFVITENAAFVVGTDNNLYAINKSNGNVYWRTEVKRQTAPKFDGKNIVVRSEKFDAASGEKIK